MVSTGFKFGERSAIANAYTKMYAPKRLTESRGFKRMGGRFVNEGFWGGNEKSLEQKARENREHMTDAKALAYAGYSGEPFEKMTNSIPYQVAKSKADYFGREGNAHYENAKKNEGGKKELERGMAHKYFDKADKATKDAMNSIGAKNFNVDDINPIDRHMMGIAGANKLNFNQGTNNVAYQVAKTKAEIGDGFLVDNEKDAERAFRANAGKIETNDSAKNESCCNGVCRKTISKLPRKHKIPLKTGSKLGKRPVLPFKKRDVKSSAKKYTPKLKKVVESNHFFCIADGNRTLCTNDSGQSYFNKGGICGNTRIYESKISAMKDIGKVKARRNPNSKYKVRTCECIGESVRFVDRHVGRPVNEGLWDGLAGGITNAVKGVGDMVGNVGSGVLSGASNIAKNVPVAGGLVSGALDAGNEFLFGQGGQQQAQPQQQAQQAQQQKAPQQGQQRQAQPQQQPQQRQTQQPQQQTAPASHGGTDAASIQSFLNNNPNTRDDIIKALARGGQLPTELNPNDVPAEEEKTEFEKYAERQEQEKARNNASNVSLADADYEEDEDDEDFYGTYGHEQPAQPSKPAAQVTAQAQKPAPQQPAQQQVSQQPAQPSKPATQATAQAQRPAAQQPATQATAQAQKPAAQQPAQPNKPATQATAQTQKPAATSNQTDDEYLTNLLRVLGDKNNQNKGS